MKEEVRLKKVGPRGMRASKTRRRRLVQHNGRTSVLGGEVPGIISCNHGHMVRLAVLGLCLVWCVAALVLAGVDTGPTRLVRDGKKDPRNCSHSCLDRLSGFATLSMASTPALIVGRIINIPVDGVVL